MADDEQAQVGWSIPYQGETYLFRGVEDLTVSWMRKFKQWGGPEYGKVTSLITLFIENDVDAVTFVLWALLRREADKPGSTVRCPDTPFMLPDFSFGSLVSDTRYTVDPTPPVVEPEPLERSSPLTQDSTPILTNSEDDISDLSSSTVTSRRKRSTT